MFIIAAYFKCFHIRVIFWKIPSFIEFQPVKKPPVPRHQFKFSAFLIDHFLLGCNLLFGNRDCSSPHFTKELSISPPFGGFRGLIQGYLQKERDCLAAIPFYPKPNRTFPNLIVAGWLYEKDAGEALMLHHSVLMIC